MIEALHCLIRRKDAGDGIRFARDIQCVTAGDPNIWGRLDVSEYAVGVCPDPGDVLRTELTTPDSEGEIELLRTYPFALYDETDPENPVLTAACDPAMRQEFE